MVEYGVTFSHSTPSTGGMVATAYSIGDRVRTNVIYGRDDYAATGVIYDTRPRYDGATDYMVKLDEPVTMAGHTGRLMARTAGKLRTA